MGLLAPSPDKPVTPAAPPAAPPAAVHQPNNRGPLFQPADHLFAVALGDGIRNSLPLEIVDGWTRPLEDLSFDIRQMTIAENCRAHRMAEAKSVGSDTPYSLIQREQVGNAIRRIGAVENPDDAYMSKWIDAIGFQGWAFIWGQFLTVHLVTEYAVAKFEASKRRDVAARRVTYSIPAQTLPRKRWAARTAIACKWEHKVDAETLVDSSHWIVDGKPAEPGVADSLGRDLTFTMQELKQGDSTVISDLVEDPDDKAAVRVMEVMYSLVSIGGTALANTPTDLAVKRQWLEDIGPRAQRLVTGVWVKMHEVDHAKMATFLDAATPLD